MQPVITESKVKEIARKEDVIVEKKLTKKIVQLECSIAKNTEILKRLERLLLGEEGVNDDDTIKGRNNFAYLYARHNADMKLVERSLPALEWYEDMDHKERGDKENKLETLGKVITFYSNIRWILGIIGATTIINAIPIIQGIIVWIEKLSN